ncbi:MAG TPA: ABC transporter permease, partial [Longimicrobiales bacterium]|nr:ABC transporter permease [Longimicrobiales bacterium]
MRFGFAARLALREGRHGFRRVGVYMASISLGVAALVSIHSFRDDVARSVQEEADVLMGANARVSSRRAFPDSVTRILDSLQAEGVAVSRRTTALSMVLAPASGDVRLLQVRAVGPGYPFYGEVSTSPGELWPRLARGDVALVDPAVLTQLRVRPGDTLAIGRVRLQLAGTV